ncbi:MAG: selenocysteine-specific translation elongation factor [Acidimicrobiales bacterium]
MRVVATAGHVDHGKSTLIRHLTGTDPDRLAEERLRGLTIDLGFAATMLPSGTEVAFVDVPGHARFIKNMLAGVGAVDAAMFVVAANEGWKPQSEEHLRILQLLGIGHGLVVVTKAALVDEETFELAELEIAEAVSGTFLDGAEMVAVDVHAGIGVAGEEGPGEGRGGLVDALERLIVATPAAPDRGRPRLYIDRSFALPGAGTVVTGTLTGGGLQLNERLVVEPGGLKVRVRGLHSHGRPLNEASPGRRLAVSLSGVSHHSLRRGQALVAEGQWHPSRTIDASLEVLSSIARGLGRRGAFVGYFGSGEYPVRLSVLGSAGEVGPGETGFVRLSLPVPLPLLPGDRYVLRESGRAETVGGGEILDVAPVLPVSRARPSISPERVVTERGFVQVDELERLTGVRLKATLGDLVVDPAALASAADGLGEKVRNAGAAGLDPAVLDGRERMIAARSTDVAFVDGRLFRADHLADVVASGVGDSHPYVALLMASPFSPPLPDSLDRGELRALGRRELAVDCDGLWFATEAVAQASRIVASLLARSPGGVTASQVREALGTTRRYVLPLLSHMDSTGVTRRRGDLRIAGPRLPDAVGNLSG